MAQLTVVYWRDIPAQVIVKAGRRDQAKRVLDERFEKAIDRAAMRGGARGTDDYLAQWRRADPVEVSNDLEAEAAAKAAELEAAYDDARLAALVAAGGHDTGPEGTP
ncbi:MAG: virulence factor [Hyphomicrobiales bacterium]|nr:virulence factor [Hyphomicrobiales bacterium]MCP5370707.1 virulence factor [Hyphomicrobiales bacterium]